MKRAISPARHHVSIVAVLAAVVVAACGSDDDATDDTVPVADRSAATTAATDPPADTTTPDTTTPDTTTPDTGAATTAAPGLGYGDVADTTAAPADAGGAPLVELAETDLGAILVQADGFTVYGFTPDADGTPTCYDDCAAAWPPVLVRDTDTPISVGEGLDAAAFSTVARDNGDQQLVMGDWPLYTYAGDTPGDVNGQGLQGVWFVVDAQGQLVME